MTFKIELINHKVIKNAFESISKIVNEITLTADKEGIHLRSLDKSHITFITMELNYKLFDQYQCDEPTKIAVDCTEFTKILKKCKTTDTLELTVDEDNLIILMKGDATRKFKLRQIDMEYDNPIPPQIEHPCNITIQSDLLKDYINDMSLYSEVVQFGVDEDYFIISSEGQNGEAEIKYIHGENIKEYVKSKFAIEKLQDMLKSSKFAKNTILYIGEDMPLKLIMELTTGDGELGFLLAPRLSEE